MSGRRQRSRQGAVLVPLAALVLTTAACGGDPAPETTPEGAVVLTENQPSNVGGASVVATDVEGDDATLQVVVDGPATSSDVSEGDEVDIDGDAYRVEAVWSEGDGLQPGSKGGRVMVVPAGS